MRPSIYWLDLRNDFRLAIMPRPRAGDWLADEIAGWKAEGIDVVVSLLEPDEVAELDLRDVPVLCRSAGIEHVSFPIADRGVPASVRETEPPRSPSLRRPRHQQGRGRALPCGHRPLRADRGVRARSQRL